MVETPPSESACLEYLAQVDHGYEHAMTMLGVILANSLEAINSANVMFSESFEAPGAMSTEALESLRAMCTEAVKSLRALFASIGALFQCHCNLQQHAARFVGMYCGLPRLRQRLSTSGRFQDPLPANYTQT